MIQRQKNTCQDAVRHDADMLEKSVFTKVSMKQLDHGGFDIFCRGCRTQSYVMTAELADGLKRMHAKCPDLPRLRLSEVD